MTVSLLGQWLYLNARMPFNLHIYFKEKESMEVLIRKKTPAGKTMLNARKQICLFCFAGHTHALRKRSLHKYQEKKALASSLNPFGCP